jgi:arginyl-tRNA synthetase
VDFPELSLVPAALAGAKLEILTDSAELGLIKQLMLWPRTVESAALAHEPHRIAFYLQELAAAFHALWNLGKDNEKLRFLVAGDKDLTAARLALLAATAQVIASGLGIFGVEPVEEMK